MRSASTFVINAVSIRRNSSKALLKFLVLGLLEKFQIICKQEMIVKFTCRTRSDLKKTMKLAIASPSTSFCNVGRNRGAASPNLTRKAIEFLFRKTGGLCINFEGQFVSFQPNP